MNMSDLKKLREDLHNCLSEKRHQLVETLQNDKIDIDEFRKQSIEVNELVVQINLIDTLIEAYSHLDDINNISSALNSVKEKV